MNASAGKHILLVADGRSTTAQSWVKCVLGLGYKVSLVSSFPCAPLPGLSHFSILPVAFSRFSSQQPGNSSDTRSHGVRGHLRGMFKKHYGVFQHLRYRLGPLTVKLQAGKLQRLVNTLQPDLIHALRIPFEGMLVGQLDPGIPRVVSTWGNDLTLHADQSPAMRRLTCACLASMDGIISDTQRDLDLALEWGLRSHVPTLHVPGSGGLNLAQIFGADPQAFDTDTFHIPDTGLWAVNSRGYRPGYVHQDVFFESIPIVLAQIPDLCFICPGLANPEQQAWLIQQGLQERVFLLPLISQAELWSLNKRCALFISPSSHDGTPNSLIESMAAGCYPIAGDIPTLHEWIENGRNGSLVEPHDPQQLAQTIITAVKNPQLRAEAASYNRALISTRADIRITSPKIKTFYDQVIGKQ